jgi:PTH1 family peptidyl-tRNA hydrolase
VWFIVGLGNPGARYERTRHNAGFRVVDALARRWDLDVSRARRAVACDAHWGEGRVARQPALLAKPQSFMNRSGQPTRDLMDARRGELTDLIVVHDELDLPFGTVRLKRGGGTGGHNGLADIDRHLGERGYLRVRVGVGRPAAGQDAADYVLADFGEDEIARVEGVIDAAADSVELILREGVERAMNRLNVRPKKTKTPHPNTTLPGPAPEQTAPDTHPRS